jgi:hypothetical protein
MIDEPTEGTGGRLQSMATATKTKALRIATRCATVEQFVTTFHRFCDETSFFISTLGTRPVGLETAFSIQLEGGKPVLQGLGVVLDAWTTPRRIPSIARACGSGSSGSPTKACRSSSS